MNEIHCDQDLTIQNKYLATNIVDELYIYIYIYIGVCVCVCVCVCVAQKSIWPPPRQQSCF